MARRARGVEGVKHAAGTFIAALLCLLVLACTSVKADPDVARDHRVGDHFVNSDGSSGGKSFGDLARWVYERTRDGLPKPPSTFVDGYRGFPVIRPDIALLKANHSETTVTWIGHATLLVQMAGINVLTDPHFSERTFAVQWAGPERKVPLPMQLSELPHIDLVVISHNHYDHLDVDTVRALAEQPGGSPLFAVPLGVDAWMRAQGIEKVQAFDWWQMRSLTGMQALPTAQSGARDPALGDVELSFVPAHHWSSRTPWDRNKTLWGGWVVKAVGAPAFSFYFAGDTGYSADFVEIGKRFGAIDLAAIPVGAYEPRWFMSGQHVNPAEAVQMHKDLRARRSVGIHWGTFELTDEPLDAPLGALPAARDAAGVPERDFFLMRHGETRVIAPGS